MAPDTPDMALPESKTDGASLPPLDEKCLGCDDFGYTHGELADGSKIDRACRKCGGTGRLLTPAGIQIMSLLLRHRGDARKALQIPSEDHPASRILVVPDPQAEDGGSR